MIGVDRLRAEAREWAKSVVELYNTEVPASMEADKQKLLNRAKGVKTAIEKVFGTLDELKPIAQIQELGAIPLLVPAAAIAAAAAAISTWYLSYKKFRGRIDEYKLLVNSGLTHEQSLSVIGNDENVFQSAKKLIIPAGLLGAAFLFFK